MPTNNNEIDYSALTVIALMLWTFFLLLFGFGHYFFVYKPNKKKGKATGFLTGKKKTL